MTRTLLIGTGRAAFHFGHAIRRAGGTLVGIVGRHHQKATDLADALGCPAYEVGSTLPPADMVLIAVSDDAIAEVAARIPVTDAVVVHTSGASSLERLAPHPDRGVIWPVMTLSPGEPMDLRNVPLVIDGNTDRASSAVEQLATGLSGLVTRSDQDAREVIHAAAAISTNFPLFLLGAAQGLLTDHGIDPGLLMPSFQAMAAKAASIGAEEALTGPARRGDLGTIRRHLDRLTHDPELRAAYALISRMILRKYGHPDPDG